MDDIKAIIDALAALYNAYDQATANGQKLTWASLFSLGPVFMALPNAINGFNAAVKETEALTADEAAQLEAYVISKLPADAGNVASYIKYGTDAGLKLAGVYQDVMAVIALAKGQAAQPIVASAEAPKLESPEELAKKALEAQALGH